METTGILLLIFFGAAGLFALTRVLPRTIGGLRGISDGTVGHGQHGSARWMRKRDFGRVWETVEFDPEKWRRDPSSRPKKGGVLAGCVRRKGKMRAYAECGDVHVLMIGAAGVGKTAYWLYPCLEYALATGVGFLATDTKGDLARHYARIASEDYGYRVSVMDLRNPTRSDGCNLLEQVNRHMDLYEATGEVHYRASAEKYAKIIARTLVMQGSGETGYGQNTFFYEAAEGLITAAILLVAQFGEADKRHIVSVFRILSETFRKDEAKDHVGMPEILEALPSVHKARWFASAVSAAENQTLASVISTALSRLNVFLDTELESILCRPSSVSAGDLADGKTALFIILPEEDPTKYSIVSLLIQEYYRELLACADENGGRLRNRVIFFCDEFGTFPKIESAEMMFSAARSRGLMLVPVIQSFAQLRSHYGNEGAEIIVDNVQLTLFGGFAPNSSSAKVLSESMGSRTAQTGSLSLSAGDSSKTVSMMARPLMTQDELKRLPKGTFIVERTGCDPARMKFRLFRQWGIVFDKPYEHEPEDFRMKSLSSIDLIRAVRQAYPRGHGDSGAGRISGPMEHGTQDGQNREWPKKGRYGLPRDVRSGTGAQTREEGPRSMHLVYRQKRGEDAPDTEEPDS